MRGPETTPLPDSDAALFEAIESAIRADGGPMISLADLCAATGYDRAALRERVLRVCTSGNYLRVYSDPDRELVVVMY